MQKTGKLLEDNAYLYGIILKGRYSTVMDDAAYRAHQGMTANGAHSKDPPMDDTADGGTTRIH